MENRSYCNMRRPTRLPLVSSLPRNSLASLISIELFREQRPQNYFLYQFYENGWAGTRRRPCECWDGRNCLQSPSLQGLGRSVDLLQHQRAALRHECVGSSALPKFSWSYLSAVQQK